MVFVNSAPEGRAMRGDDRRRPLRVLDQGTVPVFDVGDRPVAVTTGLVSSG